MINETLLKELLYAIRGVKRRVYTHYSVPTTKDPEGPKIASHRCSICKHSAVGEAELDHHKSCPMPRMQEKWRQLKEERPDLFDFSDMMPNREAGLQAAMAAVEQERDAKAAKEQVAP